MADPIRLSAGGDLISGERHGRSNRRRCNCAKNDFGNEWRCNTTSRKRGGLSFLGLDSRHHIESGHGERIAGPVCSVAVAPDVRPARVTGRTVRTAAYALRNLSTSLRHLPYTIYCRSPFLPDVFGGLIQTAVGGSAGCGSRRTNHPIHLHGHSFRVISRGGRPTPHREWLDTVLLSPRESAEIAFVADNPGEWMFHCHVLEHQAGGMMTCLRVT